MEFEQIKQLIINKCLDIEKNGSFDINFDFTCGVISMSGSYYAEYKNNNHQRFDDEQFSELVNREVIFSEILISYDDEREKYLSCKEICEIQDELKIQVEIELNVEYLKQNNWYCEEHGFIADATVTNDERCEICGRAVG